jgi:hypothetical protein
VQSFQSGAPQGAIASQHLALQKQQTEAIEGTMVGKLEMPALKYVKSEYTGLGGVKAEYMIQDSLNQAASMRMSQDSACQEASYAGVTTATQQSVFDEGATSNQHLY